MAKVIGIALLVFAIAFLIGNIISIFKDMKNRKRAAEESGENKTEEKNER